MKWWQVLWAVLLGIAGGISADWENFYARNYGDKTGQASQPGPGEAAAAPTGTTPPNPASTPASTTPGPQVKVDVPQREGEFAAGLPYVAGPHVAQRHETARGDGESRRKKRTRPAPSPAETLCARCKAAIERELTTSDHAELTVAQEAEHEVLETLAHADVDATQRRQGQPSLTRRRRRRSARLAPAVSHGRTRRSRARTLQVSHHAADSLIVW